MAGYSPGTSYTQQEIDYVYDLKVYYVMTIYVIPRKVVQRRYNTIYLSSWSAGNHPETRFYMNIVY